MNCLEAWLDAFLLLYFHRADRKSALPISSDDAMRAEAYLWLARNAEAAGLAREACSYATVVVTLFQAPALVDEAKKILAAHPEENE